MELMGDSNQALRIAYLPGATAHPGIKVKSLVVYYEFSKLGYIPLGVHYLLLKVFQLHCFGTFRIEPIFFTLVTLLRATVLTIKTVLDAVMLIPVVGNRHAGYPAHYGLGEGLVTVIPLHIGQGDYYLVE